MDSICPPIRKLKVGDRVRLVHFPQEFTRLGACLHRDTRRLYKLLLARRRSVRVYHIDDWGGAWIRCRFRRKNGRWEGHFLLISHESGWVRVKPRAAKRRVTKTRPRNRIG